MSSTDHSAERSDEMEREQGQDPLIGSVVDGSYEVLRYLNKGGVGRLYEVRHQASGVLCVLKTLRHRHRRDERAARRFVREAKAASAADSPHIVRVRDAGFLADGSFFYVMEKLDGRSLARVLREEGPQPEQRVARLALQIANALGAAHKAGIVHRDITAQNILLLQDDEGDFIKVIDFGFAHIDDAGEKLTRAGRIVGTPAYMSPEQCMAEAVDGRSDLYSLGVVLFELLTGELPFVHEDASRVAGMHLVDPLPRFAEANPEVKISERMESVVRRCLKKKPEHRFQSARELQAALLALLEGDHTGRYSKIDAILLTEPPEPEPSEPEPGSGAKRGRRSRRSSGRRRRVSKPSTGIDRTTILASAGLVLLGVLVALWLTFGR